ncbi:ABC transporter permease [Novibacillus thermophilus]|uniref:Iron export ABC transporter permease subunit FetB n=1 Tax=Novibacillus thermophilus TaxID=1471761 RepID=A0A1U9K4D0_9BACL|nr:iron export ABC transporter permease subunit FetB [Novibacillus thermophilus]AQS54883.1 iron export ABC transporter permease subunit FetB [Novibacillus thermophilus]
MSTFALSMTLIFIFITLFLSMWQKLRLEKDIVIATIRTAVQLTFIGFVLEFVFEQKNAGFVIGVIAIMVTVAAYNAASRGKDLKGLVWRVWFVIATTEAVTMGIMVVVGIIEPRPETVVPISGMIVGNAMVVASLLINQLKESVRDSVPEIEVLLALGASQKQSMHRVLKRAVKSSMIPTIDSMKTVGLVQLPGMMTGMIIAGTSPIEAVKYQILIMFAITGSAALTSILLGMLTYGMWLTRDLQVKDILLK